MPENQTSDDDKSTELEREFERGTRLRGYRYGLHDFRAQVGGVEALRKMNDFVESAWLKSGMTDAERMFTEMAIIAACVGARDTVARLQCHMHAAHKAGATPEEILALVDMIAPWVGEPARVAGVEAWRATFRPDLPPVDRVVELR